MSIEFFGKGDDLYIHELMASKSALGSVMSYTDPSVDWFYSEYGWAYPLDYNSVPYEYIVGNKCIFPKGFVPYKAGSDFLLIDTELNLWKILIGINEDGTKNFQSYPILSNKGGWFIYNNGEMVGSFQQHLTGFLATDPSEEKIKAYIYENHDAKRFIRLSISEIGERMKLFVDKNESKIDKKE